MFCKKGVLRNFAKFTGNHLLQSLFFNKVAGLHLSLKRDSSTGFFLWILRNFWEHLILQSTSSGCFLVSQFNIKFHLPIVSSDATATQRLWSKMRIDLKRKSNIKSKQVYWSISRIKIYQIFFRIYFFGISYVIFYSVCRDIQSTYKNLTLSWRRLSSYGNQSIDLLRKSMDWFLYDNGLRHERVNNLLIIRLSGVFRTIWNIYEEDFL